MLLVRKVGVEVLDGYLSMLVWDWHRDVYLLCRADSLCHAGIILGLQRMWTCETNKVEKAEKERKRPCHNMGNHTLERYMNGEIHI